MSRKTFFKSLGAVLLLLLVVVYMGYQVMENLTEKIVTADALEVTAQDKISPTGIFVRRETPLYPQHGPPTGSWRTFWPRARPWPSSSPMKTGWSSIASPSLCGRRSKALNTPSPI